MEHIYTVNKHLEQTTTTHQRKWIWKELKKVGVKWLQVSSIYDRTAKQWDTQMKWNIWYAFQSPLKPNAPVSSESRDNHLIVISLCFHGGRVPGEHSLSLLRSVIFSQLEVFKGRDWVDDFKPSETQANFFADERKFTFNLSVVTFLHCLVIWTFDIN